MSDQYKVGDTVVLKGTFHKGKVVLINENRVVVQCKYGTARHLTSADILRVETSEDLKGECS